MSTHSTKREISNLQQDAPVAILPTLSNEEVLPIEVITEKKHFNKEKDVVKPFFLYPRDGLYGLL